MIWAGAAAGAEHVVTVCIPDQPAPPMTYPDRDGQSQTVLRAAFKRAGLGLEFVTRPRARCLHEVAQGTINAIVPVTAIAEFTDQFAFPRQQGTVDESRRVQDFIAVLVVRKNSPVRWDGRQLSGLSKALVVPAGYKSAQDFLSRWHLRWEAVSRGEQMGKMLLAGRVDAALMLQEVAKEMLQDSPYREELQILEPDLFGMPVYLAFNKRFAAEHAEEVARIWAAIGFSRGQLGLGR